MTNPGPGIVYTETMVYSPTPQFAAEVPYQLAIVELEGGLRVSSRILGERACIGDHVEFVEFRNDVPYFRKSA